MKKNKRSTTNEDAIKEVLDDFDRATPASKILKEMRENPIDWDTDHAFEAQYLKSLFVEQALAAMRKNGVSRNELARRLGKSRQYVGRILNESANFTIETMSAIAYALGLRLEIRLSNSRKEEKSKHELKGELIRKTA